MRPDLSLIRSYEFDLQSRFKMPDRQTIWNQIIYASSGVLTVRSKTATWVVPPQRAVWVPHGLQHSVELHGGVNLRTLHLHPSLASPLPSQCCVLNVTPFFRELILHVIARCPLLPTVPEESRLIGVLTDQLATVDTAPLSLPTISDPRAATIVNWFEKDPADPRTLQQFATKAGASPRTLERIFKAETGLGFAQWKRQFRLLCGLQLLASGESVSNVAERIGYETPSAFIAVFRAAFGTTPGTYFRPSDARQSK